jgi:hypothetical protein
LHRLKGRITFLLSCLLVAVLSGGALHLLRAHAGSHRALLAVAYGLALLGIFWTRSLERRLADAGLPRWIFWPYFLIVFNACAGAHALKAANGAEMIVIFSLLQLPALFFPVKSSPNEDTSMQPAAHHEQSARKPAPMGAFEFAVYLLLIANLWQVLHLLRGDVRILDHAAALRLALDAASVLLCLLWIVSMRMRLKSLGLMRWYLSLCSILLAVCGLPLAYSIITFPHALVLFVALQIPAIFLRRKAPNSRG